MHPHRHWLSRAFLCLLYASAGLQFIRFYVRSTNFYLRLPTYLAGHERVPFQERVLPVLLMKPLMHWSWLIHHFGRATSVTTVQNAPFYLVSLMAFLIAALCTQELYRTVSTRGTLGFLVFPLFLFTVMWTYTIHLEANFSYPYDMISVASFAAGFVFIYRRMYLPLVLLMLIATWNRETTLFLIGVYILDAASMKEDDVAGLASRFAWRQVPWLRTGLLLAIWLAIKLWLGHHYRANDESENYVRLVENAGRLRIRLVPALLNICGYMFPVVLLFWRRIQPTRFQNYVWIGIPWILVMFYTGVILETRIYGELCSYTAVALVLVAEHRIATLQPIERERAYQHVT